MRVTELNVYPIKSCGQMPVPSAVVEPRGLAGDRRYMLVDEAGRFLTQRRHPNMALIRLERHASGLTVTAPGLTALELPDVLDTDAERIVQVWQDELTASLADSNINAWFSDFLGFPAQLVCMGDAVRRALKPGRGQPDDQVSFADGSPLLLISQASLAELNRRLPQAVTMQRFRPNIVVSAREPFAEDGWRRIRIGDVEFEVGWACTRCVLTTVDPTTGERDPDREPLRTLSSFRRVGDDILFGQNLIPRRLGVVRVGDRVDVLEAS